MGKGGVAELTAAPIPSRTRHTMCLPEPRRPPVNAFKRLHDLIPDLSGLDLNLSPDTHADRGADRTMDRPRPRRARVATGLSTRRGTPMKAAPDRIKEDRVNPQLTEQDVREELVVPRVRRKIEDGVYDAPDE